jgi:hypothetical protein
MQSVIIHILNEDPIVGEVEELPSPTDSNISVRNPRRRDGKDLGYIDTEVSQVIWPINRVMFIEVLPGEEDEEVITFVRE